MSEPKLAFVAADMAYEDYVKMLIEKDKAKAPEIIYGSICCPNCKKVFDDVRGPYGVGPNQTNHCPNCGQRLDWNSRRSEPVDVEKIAEEMKRRKLLDKELL